MPANQGEWVVGAWLGFDKFAVFDKLMFAEVFVRLFGGATLIFASN